MTGDQTISTPNYPSNYPMDKICTWTVNAPQGYQVMLEFLDFDIEAKTYFHFVMCHYDYVSIFDGPNTQSKRLAKTCGTKRPGPFKSTSNSMTVKFDSDEANTMKGFQAKLSLVGCGGAIMLGSEATTITSPNYPGNYPNDKDCVWEITATSPGSKIKVDFQWDFDVEKSMTCSWDYVVMYNSLEAGSPETERKCGTGSSSHTSNGNTMKIHFHSDDSTTRRGFKAILTEV